MVHFRKTCMVIQVVLMFSLTACSKQLCEGKKCRQWKVDSVISYKCVFSENAVNQSLPLDLIADYDPQKFYVNVFDEHQEKLLRNYTYVIQGRKRIPVDFSTMPVGVYIVVAQSEGQKYGARQWEIQKVIDKENSVVVRDGIFYRNSEPFLPIGIYHASDPVIDIINRENDQSGIDKKLTREAMLSSLKDRGFNTIHFSWITAPPEFYQHAQQHGLMVVSESAFELNNVFQVKDMPNVLGWYTVDEPSNNQFEVISKLYNAYKQADSHHPVMTAFNHNPEYYEGRRRITDIIMLDMYDSCYPEQSQARIAPTVQSCYEKLVKHNTDIGVMIVPQLFAADGYSENTGREPSYDQVRCNVYAGIAGGARGVFYYAYYTHEPLTIGMINNPKRKHWFLPESKLWSSIGQLNAELIELKDFILLGQKWNGPTLERGNKQLAFLPAELPDGRHYLLVVNPEAQKTQIAIRIPHETGHPMTLFNESALKQEETDVWSGVLPPFGVGIYEVVR